MSPSFITHPAKRSQKVVLLKLSYLLPEFLLFWAYPCMENGVTTSSNSVTPWKASILPSSSSSSLSCQILLILSPKRLLFLPFLLSFPALIQVLVTSCLEHCEILTAQTHTIIPQPCWGWCVPLERATNPADGFYSSTSTKMKFLLLSFTALCKNGWKDYH